MQAPRLAVGGFTVSPGRHAPGSSLPWHRHAGPTLCFVYAGTFTETFTHTTFECTPGTLKVTPAEEPHSNQFGRLETEGLLVEAEPARVEQLGEFRSVLLERSKYYDERLALLAWEVAAELRCRDAAAPLAIEGLLLELLAGLARERELRRGKPLPRWVLQARDALHDAPKPGSLGELAATVGVHPVTLARGFRRAFGCTVGAYVRRLRVAQAARELAQSERPLAEIAQAAGFADQSHFSNLFRREIGLSPSAFRRAVRAPRTPP